MKPAKKRKKTIQAENDVHEMPGKINFVLPHWLERLLNILPWGILAYALFMYILSSNIPPRTENRMDEFQITGFVAYAAIFFLSGIAIRRASGLIPELWERNIFPIEAKADLGRFSGRLENLANHVLWQVVFFLLSLFIPLTGILLSCTMKNASGLDLLFCNYHEGAIRASKAAFEAVIGIFMTLVAWRVFVAAWGIRSLGSGFDLTPNWHHPDKSGGLLPIGITGFWIAGILAVPAIYLGTWQILCAGTGVAVCGNILRLESRMLHFQELLLVVIAASLVSFVWPLWTIHRVMVKKRDDLHRGELQAVGQKIHEVSRQIIENASLISDRDGDGQKALEENAILQKKLDALQKTYSDLEHLPVWPFNKETVIQLISTQGIPLLGLTGIGSKVVDILKIFFKPGP